MGLIRYSCGHISSHHEQSHVKFGVWGFFIMFYWNIVMKMLKWKNKNLMMSHFSTLLGYSILSLHTPVKYFHRGVWISNRKAQSAILLKSMLLLCNILVKDTTKGVGNGIRCGRIQYGSIHLICWAIHLTGWAKTGRKRKRMSNTRGTSFVLVT